MGDLAGEVTGGQALRRQWAHGLADVLGGQAGQATEHLPLFGDGELLETGVAAPRTAIDVLLQASEQAVLAAMAQEEIGAAAQVLFELTAGAAGRGCGSAAT